MIAKCPLLEFGKMDVWDVNIKMIAIRLLCKVSVLDLVGQTGKTDVRACITSVAVRAHPPVPWDSRLWDPQPGSVGPTSPKWRRHRNRWRRGYICWGCSENPPPLQSDSALSISAPFQPFPQDEIRLHVSDGGHEGGAEWSSAPGPKASWRLREPLKAPA